MHIEIVGTQFVNKGAELMLLSILNEFKKRNFNAKFSMEADIYFSPYEKRIKHGLYTKLPYYKKGINYRFLNEFISKNTRLKYGLVIDKELDIVLDASGFLYSDQWGKNSAKKLATSVKYWKEQGTKTILLPQAFGPFNSSNIKKDMKIVLEYSDLIFARDQISYEYLMSIDGNKNNIYIAPDFTNLMEVSLKYNDFDLENKICIIPNKRMLDMTKNSTEYLSILKQMIDYLDKNNQEYFFLIHEGEEDRKIIEKLSLKQDSLILDSDDALEIKQIIGLSKGMIGSRFHGLVSSLTQGKPVIALGWSHKYIELLKDYSVENYYVNLNENVNNLEILLSVFIDNTLYNDINQRILLRSKEVKEKSKKMWDKVFEVINER